MTATPIVPQNVLDHYLSQYKPHDLGEIRGALASYHGSITRLIQRNGFQPNPSAIIVTGPGGSGKSTLMRTINHHICVDYERALNQAPTLRDIFDWYGNSSDAIEPLQEASLHLTMGGKHNADHMLNTLVDGGMPVAFEITGHTTGMGEFLPNFAKAGYSTALWLTDAPQDVRKRALSNHHRVEKRIYADPVKNEAKVTGIGQNLPVFARNACELSIYGRQKENQPLALLAKSDYQGDIKILDPKGLMAFANYSDVLASSPFAGPHGAEDFLAHHSQVRREALRRERVASAPTSTPTLQDYFGPCRPVMTI